MNSLIVLCSALLLLTPVAAGTDYKLYYLGGQSNMDGYGHVEKIPAPDRGGLDGVFIFHGNTSPDGAAPDGRGMWAPLRAGHGAGFRSDGKTSTYSQRFGCEYTLGQRLRELDPDNPVALIKYSRGGTSIDRQAAGEAGCWDPDFEAGDGEGDGINQYDHFLATMRHAMAIRDIDGDGEHDRLIPQGIVWMQGESDAYFTKEVAGRYEQNLRRLMDLIRAALWHDDLPVVIGRISDSGGAQAPVWRFGKEIRAAQAAYVKKDGSAALITATDSYGYSDPAHYDTAGYLDLGRQFADALWELEQR